MNTKNFKFMRGARLLQALEEMTLADLEKNIVTGFPGTTKRQHATDPVHIVNMKMTPYKQTTDLFVDCVANSSGKKYDTKMLFLDSTFDEDDTNDNVTFTGSDGDVHHIKPIALAESNVKVRCTCLDFYYRFSVWNNSADALYGQPFPTYQRKTDTRPPVNPDQVPGVCKHIIKTVQALKDAGIVV